MSRKLSRASWLTVLAAIALLCARPAIARNPPGLEKYVGQYQVTGDFFVSVTLENGKLMLQATGQPRLSLASQSGDNFVIEGTQIKISFVKDAQGEVTQMFIHQGAADVAAKKISSQAGPPPTDKSAHKAGFVSANGIKMHYLDWGGTGDVLLLLTGFGDNAHVFDDFAPRFTDRFRVVALTRRGFGETERPQTGYELAARVEDIRAFLDAMKIERANVVGHSLAGDEMTLLATRYPQRVIKMVYLDAAYDRATAFDCAMNPPGGMPPLYKRLLMEALNCPGAAAVTVTEMPPPDVYNVLVSTMRSASAFHPNYSKVKAPALAIYSDIEKPEMLMPLDEETGKKFAAWWKTEQVPKSRASIEQFRKEMKGGQVAEIKDADHYLFRGKTADEVYRLTRAFLLK